VDQRLATEWVRDNIAAFGGRLFPSCLQISITLFGESAGGGSTDIYAYAWADAPNPVVNGFIPQSGSASMSFDIGMGNSAWHGVSKALGCGNATAGAAIVSCMQTKD
jgi:carboxylesterase type B